MSVLALLVLAPKKDCHPLSPPFPSRAAQQGRPGQTRPRRVPTGESDWTDKGSHFPSKHAKAQSGRYSNSRDLTRTLTLSSGLFLLGRLWILPGPSCSPFIHGGQGKHLFSASPPRLPTAQGPRGKAGGPEPGPLLR